MKNNSTLFIVGATGYLGSTLFRVAKEQGNIKGTSSSGEGDLLPLRLDMLDNFA